MVDVAAKSVTPREAVAECSVRMAPGTVAAVRDSELAKGDALAVARVLEREGFDVSSYEMLPDNRERIIDTLLGAAGEGYELVVTTGGTGLGPRDITPQATRAVIDYEVPGLAEQMRRAGARGTPRALLSRSLAGVRSR